MPGPAAGRQGGRGTARRTNADNTWAAEGAARRTGAPEAVGISQGTQHNEPRKVRLAVAPMSRVHDKADKSVSGKWVIGVGREANCSGSRKPLKWWVLQ